ncbi:MAG: type II secretion system F family protein [Thermodesulfobacteriota bacterium]|nr:type II secretion system F family protein [Thermodesulfobacteriota bacterium]
MGEIIIYMAIFASVVISTLVGLEIVQKGFSQYEEKYVEYASRTLDSMFISFSPEQLFYINLLITISFAFVSFLITFNLFAAVLFGIIGAILPRIILWQLKKRRMEKFNQQLSEILPTLSGSLRAGFTLIQAIDYIIKETQPPIAQEFGLLVRENKLGVPLDQALENLSKRVPSEDLSLVVSSATIARSTGGNLAEIFDLLANTIRERYKMEGKVKALTSQGRMQGMVVGLMPFGLGLVLYWMDPESMIPLFTTWIGYLIITACLVLLGLGGLFIKKIVSVDV